MSASMQIGLTVAAIGFATPVVVAMVINLVVAMMSVCKLRKKREP